MHLLPPQRLSSCNVHHYAVTFPHALVRAGLVQNVHGHVISRHIWQQFYIPSSKTANRPPSFVARSVSQVSGIQAMLSAFQPAKRISHISKWFSVTCTRHISHLGRIRAVAVVNLSKRKYYCRIDRCFRFSCASLEAVSRVAMSAAEQSGFSASLVVFRWSAVQQMNRFGAQLASSWHPRPDKASSLSEHVADVCLRSRLHCCGSFGMPGSCTPGCQQRLLGNGIAFFLQEFVAWYDLTKAYQYIRFRFF